MLYPRTFNKAKRRAGKSAKELSRPKLGDLNGGICYHTAKKVGIGGRREAAEESDYSEKTTRRREIKSE